MKSPTSVPYLIQVFVIRVADISGVVGQHIEIAAYRRLTARHERICGSSTPEHIANCRIKRKVRHVN
jgi:hypothetical protein